MQMPNKDWNLPMKWHSTIRILCTLLRNLFYWKIWYFIILLNFLDMFWYQWMGSSFFISCNSLWYEYGLCPSGRWSPGWKKLKLKEWTCVRKEFWRNCLLIIMKRGPFEGFLSYRITLLGSRFESYKARDLAYCLSKMHWILVPWVFLK